MDGVKNPSLHFVVMSADCQQLLGLLEHAKVSIGHWNGRKIEVPGFEGQMTF